MGLIMKGNSNIDLSVKIGGLTLKNPILVASGTFSYEYRNFYEINRLGAIVTKTITPEPKIGNPPPRLYETESGLLNSIGLQNPGIRKFLSKEIKEYKNINTPLIVSISASKIIDFVYMIEQLENCEQINGYEVNISCPNVENEGLAFGTNPDVVYDLTKKLSEKTKRALIVKLSPNVTDICRIALAAEAGKATAISLINTLQGMAIDYRNGKSFISQMIAGYSGPAIKPVALACVYKVAKHVKIPIIAMGGVSSHKDVLEFIYAGAEAVAIGTAQFSNPLLPIKIIEDLTDYCEIEKISLKQIRGKTF